ncbi:DUF4433 domain-containing protein [Desulfobacterales bacterium HSG17]|nr:DUF4433 domain-containing protein [Desulfobacterales bacterium HSG17]
MPVPNPTWIFRFIHIDNLEIYLQRGGIHSPNHTPDDGFVYKTIHNIDIQSHRRLTQIPCSSGGSIHDYVPFYFGPRSPMLYRLHTRWETDYKDGQESLIYLISTVQTMNYAGKNFVFSDGHGIAVFTEWFDNLANLNNVDWETVYTWFWRDTVEDMDRQRRKQAEFLVYGFCEWSLIHEIGVINNHMKSRAENIMKVFQPELHRPVYIRRDWYY